MRSFDRSSQREGNLNPDPSDFLLNQQVFDYQQRPLVPTVFATRAGTSRRTEDFKQIRLNRPDALH